MPDRRPLSSLRLGPFDNPQTAATSPPLSRRAPAAPPPSNMENSERTAHGSTADDRPPSDISLSAPPSNQRRRLYIPSSTRRRRRRSDSMQETHSNTSPRSPQGNTDMEPRESKRRRIDTQSAAPPPQPIKYGHYGQVEPGRLKMELISCDGGEHRDPRHPATSLGPENILRHDKSVYCSEREYCNIVLRHADRTPFCLEKLYIIGPEHGFTAPVCAGTVCVAMTMEDLEKYLDPPPPALARAPPSPPHVSYRSAMYNRRRAAEDRASRSSTPELLSITDALRDPLVNAHLEARQRQHDLAEEGRALDAEAQAELSVQQQLDHDSERGHRNSGFYDENFPHTRNISPHGIIYVGSGASDLIPGAYPFSSSLVYPDRPIVMLSDEEIHTDDEDSSTQEVLDYRLQRLRLARRRFEADEGRWITLNRRPSTTTAAPAETGAPGAWGLNALMARSRVHDSTSPERDTSPVRIPLPIPIPSSMNPATTPANVYDTRNTQKRTVYSGKARDKIIDNNDDKVHFAPFHMQEDKHSVAMSFVPALSGRFILLRLWADRKTNVDVESIVAKGYGGCRFFPAVEMR